MHIFSCLIKKNLRSDYLNNFRVIWIFKSCIRELVIWLFYIDDYHWECDQVLFFSFLFLSVPLRKALSRSTWGYIYIFFLHFGNFRGWDNLLIVVIRPLKFFQISEMIIPLSMFENVPETKVSQIAWKTWFDCFKCSYLKLLNCFLN